MPLPDAPFVSVSVGPIQGDGETAVAYKDTDQKAAWTDTYTTNRYEKDGHRYLLGLSSPLGYNGNTAAVVQLANPTVLWICDWTASRLKLFPKVPDPTSVDPKWVLLDEHIEEPEMRVMEDGATPFYRISGTYVYGCLKPDPRLVLNTVFPKPPWMEDVFNRKPDNSIYDGTISNTGTITQGTLGQGVFTPSQRS